MTNNNCHNLAKDIRGELLPPANDKRTARLTDPEWLRLQASDGMKYTNLPPANPTEDVTSGVEMEGLSEDETYTVLRDSEHVAELERQRQNIRTKEFPLLAGRTQELISSYHKTKLGLQNYLTPAEVHGDITRKDIDQLVNNPYRFYNRKPFPSFIKEPQQLSIDIKTVGVEEELKYGGDCTRWGKPVVDDTDDFKYEYLKSIANNTPMVAVEKWSAISDECLVMLVEDFDKWTVERDGNKKRYKGHNSRLTHEKWVEFLKEEGTTDFYLKGFKEDFIRYMVERKYKQLFTLLTKQPYFMTRELLELCSSLVEDPTLRLDFIKTLDGNGRDKVSQDPVVRAMFLLPATDNELESLKEDEDF